MQPHPPTHQPVQRRWVRILVASLVLFGGWLVYWEFLSGAALDPDEPFRIELGRGSGQVGLDTVRVDQDGTAVLHRVEGPLAAQTFKTATLRLPPKALEEILHSAAENRLLRLWNSYEEPGMHDGVQWVLLIRQGGTKKAVYFNNRFPDAITRFADTLDRVLKENGLDEARWQPDPSNVRPGRELWDSIR